MRDALGDRMKRQYEDRVRYYLPRRTYTIIRVDGRAFHTYTRGLQKPFDPDLITTMIGVAGALVDEIQGARLAFIQSDEVSVLATDFATTTTEAWFDGNVQKQASVAAAIATSAFADCQPTAWATRTDPAQFDARTFTIPDPVEVENYFVWRQADAPHNSISMLAQAHFSHRELHGKSTDEVQELLWQERGVNWNDLPDHLKRGTTLWLEPRSAPRRDLIPVEHHGKFLSAMLDEEVEAPYWEDGSPWYTQERDWLARQIPRHP